MNKDQDDITIRVGTFEGYPIEQTITREEIQRAGLAGMTEQEVINLTIETYRDWQADC